MIPGLDKSSSNPTLAVKHPLDKIKGSQIRNNDIQLKIRN